MWTRLHLNSWRAGAGTTSPWATAWTLMWTPATQFEDALRSSTHTWQIRSGEERKNAWHADKYKIYLIHMTKHKHMGACQRCLTSLHIYRIATGFFIHPPSFYELAFNGRLKIVLVRPTARANCSVSSSNKARLFIRRSPVDCKGFPLRVFPTSYVRFLDTFFSLRQAYRSQHSLVLAWCAMPTK